MFPRIDLGFITIPSLLFFWFLGIVSCLIYYIAVHRRFSFKRMVALLLGIIVVLLETLGAKLLFIIENPAMAGELGRLDGGFSLFGVFLFTPIFLSCVAFVGRIDVGRFLDFFAPGVLIELAWYRVGCLGAGCCGGIDVGWGINGRLFPVQPIEIALDLILFCGIVIAIFKGSIEKIRGLTFGITFCGYGVIRFALEFLWERTSIFWVISISHIWALITILVGVSFIVLSLRRSRRNKAVSAC